jgi:hypothetical protein
MGAAMLKSYLYIKVDIFFGKKNEKSAGGRDLNLSLTV